MNEDDGLEYDKDGATRGFYAIMDEMPHSEVMIFERNMLQVLHANLGFRSYMTCLYLLNKLVDRTHELKRTLVLDYNKDKARLIFRAEVRDTPPDKPEEDEDGEEWKNPKKTDT